MDSVKPPARQSCWQDSADSSERLREHLDALLILGGLFSAINSLFLISTLPLLSPDPEEDTNELLLFLLRKQDDTRKNGSYSLPSKRFSPSRDAISINLLFSLSLTFSLASTFAVLVQQVITSYQDIISVRGSDPASHAARSAGRWAAKFGVLWLLQASLMTFCVSLVLYLHHLEPMIGGAVAGMVGLVVGLLIRSGVLYTRPPPSSVLPQGFPGVGHILPILSTLKGLFVSHSMTQRQRRPSIVILKLPSDRIAYEMDPACWPLELPQGMRRRISPHFQCFRVERSTLEYFGYHAPALGLEHTPGDETLASYIQRHPQLTETEKLKLILGAAWGLARLHHSRPPIAHGDVRADNVIVSEVRDVRRCHRESILYFTFGRGRLATSGRGTAYPGYRAKELLEEDSSPTPESDIYAFGGLMLAVLSGKPPFYKILHRHAIIIAINNNQTALPVDHPAIPEDDPLWGLMRRCWSPEPGLRPVVGQVIDDIDVQLEQKSAKPPQWRIFSNFVENLSGV